MKVYMPTKGEIQRITTPKLFQDCKDSLVFVVHNEAARQRMQDAFPGFQAIVSNIPDDVPGIIAVGMQRNAIFDHIGLGQWCGMIDDDIEFVAGPQKYLQPKHYESNIIDFDIFRDEPPKTWRAAFAEPTDTHIMDIFECLVSECRKQNTVLAGLANHDNYFFRKRQWSYAALVVTRFCVAYNDGRQWIAPYEDVERSCYALVRYGSCLINNWFYPVTNRHNQDTGIGPVEARRPLWEQTYKEFKLKYGSLLDRSSEPLFKLKTKTFASFKKWLRTEGQQVRERLTHDLSRSTM